MKNVKISRIFALCLAALLLGALVTGCKSEEQIQQQQVQSQQDDAVYVDLRSTITVSGEGKALLTPDTAKVYFTISNKDEEAAKAQQANAEATNTVMEAIKGAGIAQGDINTGSISIYEQYNYDKTPPEILGYEASCELTVTVRDLDKLGGIITAAVAAGASNVRGPEYNISDSSKAYAEALTAAVADAQAKAQAIATSASVRLISPPVSIQETSGNQSMTALSIPKTDMVAAKASSEDGAIDTPISVSDLEIVAQVSVIFEIQ